MTDNDITLRVLEIIRGTTVDGPGFRTAIYLAGCDHHCKGCQNPQSHDPGGGVEMRLSEIMEVIREEDFNVTLSGGDPLYFPEKTIILAQEIKKYGYNIWLYTGYTYEEIEENPRLKPILQFVDTIVDGPFVENLRDLDLRFRGSSNQRIINLS